jgi:hypothetical protein
MHVVCAAVITSSLSTRLVSQITEKGPASNGVDSTDAHDREGTRERAYYERMGSPGRRKTRDRYGLVVNTGKVIIEHHAADASRELSLDCVETQRAVP